MVAVSLYRGNLHKVSDVARQWLMPARKISLKDFKLLLRRSRRALSRISHNSDVLDKNVAKDSSFVEFGKIGYEGRELEGLELVENHKDRSFEHKDGILGGVGKGVRIDQHVETKVEGVDAANPRLEIARKEEDVSDIQKRKQEIEERLKLLNEKKHSLVQALKQILNVEEELKRRSELQGVAGQPPVGVGQVQGINDSGSMSRHNTPRMGYEGNINGEAGGAETNDANHNVHLRHLVHTNGTSPLSDTQQRKSPFTTATLPSRTNSGVANSPSRFALAGHQGLPPHIPSVSISGTNYVTSSPSRAASGGTSAFRCGRA